MLTALRTPARLPAAWTLAELMVSLAATSLLSGGLLTGAIALQKSFAASQHHIVAQAEQMRLTDYMNLDLRRALTVSTDAGRLAMTIPDYYDDTGQPRDPQIKGGTAAYGPSPKQITYYKNGPRIYRTEGAETRVLAHDVSDFQLTFLDLGQSIQVSVSFLPKYQFSNKARESVRAGTQTYTTTLLRNKRQD